MIQTKNKTSNNIATPGFILQSNYYNLCLKKSHLLVTQGALTEMLGENPTFQSHLQKQKTYCLIAST